MDSKQTPCGSVYVNELCVTLANSAKDTDFGSLMTWVTNDVIVKLGKLGKPIQIPCTEDIGFRRLLYLSPGYSPEH